jgi:hypothetical protein
MLYKVERFSLKKHFVNGTCKHFLGTKFKFTGKHTSFLFQNINKLEIFYLHSNMNSWTEKSFGNIGSNGEGETIRQRMVIIVALIFFFSTCRTSVHVEITIDHVSSFEELESTYKVWNIFFATIWKYARTIVPFQIFKVSLSKACKAGTYLIGYPPLF